MKDKPSYDDLLSYTLGHANQAYFIHQHVVDAYAAQQATPYTKPITITFAWIGLYLFLEKGCTARQVQQAHVALG